MATTLETSREEGLADHLFIGATRVASCNPLRLGHGADRNFRKWPVVAAVGVSTEVKGNLAFSERHAPINKAFGLVAEALMKARLLLLARPVASGSSSTRKPLDRRWTVIARNGQSAKWMVETIPPRSGIAGLTFAAEPARGVIALGSKLNRSAKITMQMRGRNRAAGGNVRDQLPGERPTWT